MSFAIRLRHGRDGSGVLQTIERVRPSTDATTMRVRNGSVEASDGPFAATKEQIAGYAVIDCKDLDQALEIAAKVSAAQSRCARSGRCNRAPTGHAGHRPLTTTWCVRSSDRAPLDGTPTSLAAHKGKALLIVNVASRCGLTPQYAGLQRLHERYADRGFTVVGFPCNQFAAQGPGTADEIQTFCTTTYGMTFPMYEKIEVNGPRRHSLFTDLVGTADKDGHTGNIRWNFEKFLVSPAGEVIARFSPATDPESEGPISVLESALPA